MEFKTTKSGLAVPETPDPPPEKPLHEMGLLELREGANREKAIQGLSLLWDAMKLSEPGGGILPPNRYDTHLAMWEYMAKALVGADDCPYKEVLT